MPVPTTPRTSGRLLLRDEAYARICEAIVSGQLEPGEKLNDQQLATWLGTSRTPIREALARLEQNGLVVTEPGRATLVASIDDTTIEHAVQVAAALHAVAAGEAARLAERADIAEMQRRNAAFARALAAHDVAGALAADDAFHEVAVRCAGNQVLVASLDQVMPLLRWAEHRRFDSMISVESVEQHAEIVRACQVHDVAAAVEASDRNWATLQP